MGESTPIRKQDQHLLREEGGEHPQQMGLGKSIPDHEARRSVPAALITDVAGLLAPPPFLALETTLLETSPPTRCATVAFATFECDAEQIQVVLNLSVPTVPPQ